MIKYIIFDFDGTLVDSKDILVPVFNHLAGKHGFKTMGPEEIESLRGLSIIDRCKLLNFPVHKLPFLAKEFYNLYQSYVKSLDLFKGIKDLLDELERRGYFLAIISSNSESNIREFLQKKEVDHIKEILCSHNLFGKDKIIKKFIRINKLKTSEVIYVGDELRDIEACKKIGVKIIWVGWGYDLIDMAKQGDPDYIVKTPEEILKLV